MWNFEHAPEAYRLAERYAIERMVPSACAAALATGQAEVGLIPVAAYASIPGLSLVPGCTVASRGAIRSLLLVVRGGPPGITGEEPDLDMPTAEELDRIRVVALDTSSRTTAMYTQILFRRYWGRTPAFAEAVPSLDAMLQQADAAVVIGDPALFALRDRAKRERRTSETLRYLDLAHLWRETTGAAWVSAAWGVRSDGLRGLTASERLAIADDMLASRDAGLAHIPEIVAEWAPRLHLRPEIISHYLRHNIHFVLDEEMQAGMRRLYADAAELGLIAAAPPLRWLA